MRFSQQFEFHKVPEWDEYYFPYETFLNKLQYLISKMQRHKLQRLNWERFDLSDSFHLIEDRNIDEFTPRNFIPLNDKEPDKTPNLWLVHDDSLGDGQSSDTNHEDLEQPLLNLSTDVREFIEDIIHECKHINDFYTREKNRIHNGFQKFYSKFKTKLGDEINSLDLAHDLKTHGVDGLGYASSWARQFVEFYSKFSWLASFSKINIIAIQKIHSKLDKLIFDQDNSRIDRKLDQFISNLELSNHEECK